MATAYSPKPASTFWRSRNTAPAATARIASRTEANRRWPIESFKVAENQGWKIILGQKRFIISMFNMSDR